MSVKDKSSGENVYVSPEDFAHHYPWFAGKWGYSTAYECMGLRDDDSVPLGAKWGLWAHHMDNMRYKFTPNEGYSFLRRAVEGRDYFAYTSNADGCFVRSGFDRDRIYTPQGDWEHYQCMIPCRRDAFFPSRPMLDETLPLVGLNGLIPEDKIPACKFCGGPTFGNVRGGEWFLHGPHDEAQRRFLSWLDSIVASKKRLVVLEIGAGFNTPVVTRFPMESIARDIEGARLVRINPTEPQLPRDLLTSHRAVAIPAGWEVLRSLFSRSVDSLSPLSLSSDEGGSDEKEEDDSSEFAENADSEEMSDHFGRVGWKALISQLKR